MEYVILIDAGKTLHKGQKVDVSRGIIRAWAASAGVPLEQFAAPTSIGESEIQRLQQAAEQAAREEEVLV